MRTQRVPEWDVPLKTRHGGMCCGNDLQSNIVPRCHVSGCACSGGVRKGGLVEGDARRVVMWCETMMRCRVHVDDI